MELMDLIEAWHKAELAESDQHGMLAEIETAIKAMQKGTDAALTAEVDGLERVVGRLVPERTVADIPDAELLCRVVRAVTRKRPRRQEFAWVAVKEAFGLGSTYAAQLCLRSGIDPDTGADLKTPNVAIKAPVLRSP